MRGWAGQCSLVLGYMLLPDTWSQFMVQRLGEDASHPQILILAGLLSGADRQTITTDQIRDLLEKIVDDEVCCTRDEAVLAEVARVTEAVIKLLETNLSSIVADAVENNKDTDDSIVNNKNTIEDEIKEEDKITEVTDEEIAMMDNNDEKSVGRTILEGLVKMCIAVSSLTSDEKTRDLGRTCLDKLVSSTRDDDETTLMRATLPSLLKQFIQDSPAWSPVSGKDHSLDSAKSSNF